MESSNSPFRAEDLVLLHTKGISEDEAIKQYTLLTSGAYYPEVLAGASLENGIINISQKESPRYLTIWDDYRISSQANVVKFVPASGAASRMFKDLFPLLTWQKESPAEPLTEAQKTFLENIQNFAFYKLLSESCLRTDWSTVMHLVGEERYDLVIQNLLGDRGLNYAATPKGMIPFHKYPNGEIRSAVAEQMAEGALYMKDINGKVQVHFTVTPEMIELFKQHVEMQREALEDEFGVVFDVTYSVQKSSSDTICLDNDGNLFRKENGELLFRPGGHGALLSNLAELDADVIFIKNIDNVTPDHLKCDTIRYKKLLGGILIATRNIIHRYLTQIDKGRVNHAQIEEMLTFLKNVLCIELPPNKLAGDKEMLDRIYTKLHRPLRVCGMVPNQGDPGGGPFIVKEPDGSTSLQILETSQFNQEDPHSKELINSGQYFNPVDIVCSTKDHNGEPYDLESFVMPKLSFISHKSYEGCELIALEHPGLWNGSMDRWNTLFVEVPGSTFTPVKTVNDLLKQEHQVQG